MSKFTDEEIKALGLEGMTAGESEHLVLDTDPTAHGSAAQVLDDQDDLIENGPRFDFASARAEAVGLTVQRLGSSNVYEIRNANDAKATNDAIVESKPGNIVYVDFARPTKVRVDSTGGTLVIDYDLGRVEMIPFFPELRGLTINLGNQVQQWTNACQDTWLKPLLDRKVELGLPWQTFVAAGMLVRLQDQDPTYGKALVAALLAGKLPPEMERERTWAKSLDTHTLQNLVTRGLTAVETLHRKLAELQDDLQTGQIITQADVLNTLYLRDDIASGQVLLESAKMGDAIARALKHADQLGEELVQALTAEFDFQDDERLSRAAMANPEGWWTSLASIDED